MFDVYYNDSVVRPPGHGPEDDGNLSSRRSYSDQEIAEKNVGMHLNTRVDKVGDLYVIRACKIIQNGVSLVIERDTSFAHPGDNFTCWLLAKEPGPVSVVVIDDAIVSFGMRVPDLRQRYYDQFGHPALKLFTTIRGCCEVGKACEAEELCIDMNRILLPDEIPADQAEMPPPSNVVEAFQESNTLLFQDARAAMNSLSASKDADSAAAAAVSGRRWEDLSNEEKNFAMRKAAEKLGIVSS